MNELSITAFKQEDIPIITKAFFELGWHKPKEQYEQYFLEQKKGRRDVFVAWIDQFFCGYVTINWESHYPYFSANGIPEICDLNVLPKYRRLGIGSQLMERAEVMISERKPGIPIGIGVGLTADYGSAQRLYVKRGYIPDGRGIMSKGEPVSFRQQVIVDDDLCIYLTKRRSQ